MNALFEFNADEIEPIEISFGEWLPDQPELNNPGALEALNVLPLDGGYSPFPSLVTSGDPLGETVRGATAHILSEDIVQLYAGTVSGLFTRLGGGAWVNLVIGSFTEDYAWKFILVNDQMVCMHQDAPPWRNPVGTPGPIALVGGTPPRAACGAQVGDFLMLGNLLEDPDDGGNPFPSRVRWSGFNNIDSPWVTDVATQADFQDMPSEGGPVIAINGREVATIYQARSISRASYRGPPNIFDIVTVEDKRGAIARDCVVDVGAFQTFIAEDGFFIWNGVNSQPIGDTKVNRWFFNRLQYNRRSRIVGAPDFVNGCVHWAFPSATSGPCNEIITWSYRENRFSHTELDVEHLFSSALSNITAEELTEPFEDYDVSFDSEFYRVGGRQRLAGFNDAHAYGLFDGAALEATMETGEYSAPGGRRIFVDDARPIVDVPSELITMRVAKRDQFIGGSLVYSDPIAQEFDGRCPIIDDARYMRFRVEIPAAVPWQHATGVELARRAGGKF